ncbi:SixA phosphatase family protein [Ectothiorhodospira lacustris]|uniref:SixA phosphatase family protein n=1 Tax=Ectothiorhodospira lacustris TaxID=2899127 RepID=UPI001EE90B74|nr:histidine phosphatase family protein [Ectothiorhodospira lacustris]MCG5501912.1 histidine phosphatase family protein [Ectothiorhodospira lacustris]MCG5509455.1 histidine phosphatase family protein [Ectothiorhodospira lacustris]MCG5521509.1 histidine phosphatase family protein [Ectothiorhodospira lacustris]
MPQKTGHPLRSLVLVRHSQAGDAAEFAAGGREDHLRPLTDEGVSRMRRAARGLHRLVEGPVYIVTSPYVRAAQTAQILKEVFPGAEIASTPVLVPEADPQSFLDWLRGQPARQTRLVVGHEPHLSLLAGWLLAGERRSLVRMKKGGACCLDLMRGPQPGSAMLRWLMTQGQLRKLA